MPSPNPSAEPYSEPLRPPSVYKKNRLATVVMRKLRARPWRGSRSKSNRSGLGFLSSSWM